MIIHPQANVEINDSQPLEEDAPGSAPFDMEKKIQELKEMGFEKANAKRNGAPIIDLRKIAGHFKIPKGQVKEDLLKAIFKRLENNEILRTLNAPSTPAAGNTSNVENPAYRKDFNTVPRIINLLLARSSELINIEKIASRSQLQQGEVYGNNPLFKIVATQFNNPTHNSGGLAGHHEVFDEKEIDPEKISTVGKITAEQVYKYYREVVQLYKKAYQNYMSSGFHERRDFWLFCNNRTDLLYLHIAIEATHNEQVLEFMSSGAVIEGGGVDTRRVDSDR